MEAMAHRKFVDLPIKKCDFPVRCNKLPEGNHSRFFTIATLTALTTQPYKFNKVPIYGAYGLTMTPQFVWESHFLWDHGI